MGGMVNWVRKILNRAISPKENTDPDSIDYWREKIFLTIFLSGALLGVLIAIPSIFACLENNNYLQILIDIAVLIVIFVFLFINTVQYQVKAYIFLGIIYLLGVSLILSKGPYPSGFVYLVSFSIVSSIWRGTLTAVISIAVNLLTVLLIWFFISQGFLTINGFENYTVTSWISLISNLFIANTISALSVGVLLAGLERTFKNTTRLKNKLQQERNNLMVAKRKAENADRLKTIFLSKMSHELKTPINSIVGYASLIEDEKLDDLEQIYHFQNNIIQSGEMLSSLIDDLLDISLIESGNMVITKNRIDIEKILYEIKETFGEKIVSKINPAVTFHVINKLDHPGYQILTDSLRLKQVLINLIKNALKFTEKGKITLECELDNKEIVFKVIDQGIGIPLEMQQSIFNQFTRVKTDKVEKIAGTGLGLAISKEIVVNLGGKIGLVSEENKGTTFHVKLPI